MKHPLILPEPIPVPPPRATGPTVLSLRAKLMRRITSPVELVYDATTHWFVVLLCLTVGTLIMIARVSSETPLYECTATLSIHPNEVSLGPEGRRAGREVDSTIFIAEQVNLLQSNSVLEKVVNQIGLEQIQIQDVDPREGREVGVVQRLYRELSQKFKAFLDGLQPRPVGTEDEQNRQRAMNLFRRRSSVLNDRRSHLVRLGLFGTQYLRLEREMDAWITAYRNRINDITEETFQKLYDERLDFWTKEEKNARQKLEEFKKQNPGVSKERLDSARVSAANLRFHRDLLQRRLSEDPASPVRVPEPPLPASPTAPNDMLLALKGRRNSLLAEVAAMKGRVPAGATKLEDAEKELKGVEDEILRIENPLVGALVPREGPPKSPEEALREKLDLAEALLRRAVDDEADLTSKVSQLNVLVEELLKTEERLKTYKNLQDLKVEQTQSRMFVDFKVHDEPRTSTNPIGGGYDRVPLGTLAGAFLGVLLAFAIELLNPRVRFKRDLEDELGLKVVGVLPGN